MILIGLLRDILEAMPRVVRMRIPDESVKRA